MAVAPVQAPAATNCGEGSSSASSACVVIVGGAGLAIHSFWNLTRVILEYEPIMF